MLLFFRFLTVMIASFFRSRIDPLGTSVVRFTALPTDCDLNIHVNAGRYLSFMDVARMDLIGRTGLLRHLMRRGWRPIMGGAVVRYRREIRPFERFLVRSRILGWDEKWFYIEHLVEKGDQHCASAFTRTLIRKKGESLAPGEVLELLGLSGRPSPQLPELVERWRTMEDAR
jgi:acyl-CoA thioesterase FadM